VGSSPNHARGDTAITGPQLDDTEGFARRSLPSRLPGLPETWRVSKWPPDPSFYTLLRLSTLLKLAGLPRESRRHATQAESVSFGQWRHRLDCAGPSRPHPRACCDPLHCSFASQRLKRGDVPLRRAGTASESGPRSHPLRHATGPRPGRGDLALQAAIMQLPGSSFGGSAKFSALGRTWRSPVRQGQLYAPPVEVPHRHPFSRGSR
jgi:hypothetical protein